jgi:hypothetical protein
MDDNLTAQVRQRMRERDTDSLLAIWSRQDGEGWSADAYEIVRQTLLERGVTPPGASAAASLTPAAAAAGDGEGDVYHSFDRLLRVASWAGTLSWLFLALAALLLAYAVFALFSGLLAPFGANVFVQLVQFVVVFGVALFLAFFFVILQALGQIILLLLDIEDNTRQPERAKA